MEEHRLKPMKPNYDEQLFNELYRNTQSLRNKLAYGIDPKIFGVDYKEILSWFDVKFIFVFNRYCDEKSDEHLKATIINSLKFFKNRILKSSYSQKNQVNNHTLNLDDINSEGLKIEYEYKEKDTYLESAMNIMKNKLTPEAYQILSIEINPPLYVLNRLANDPKGNTTKIPSKIIGDYLGLGTKEINTFKKEIELVYKNGII